MHRQTRTSSISGELTGDCLSLDLLENLLKEGFVRVRVDGVTQLIEEVADLEKNKNHDIDIVVDRIVKKDESSNISLEEKIIVDSIDSEK